MNSLSARVRKLTILLLIALPLIGVAQTPKPEDVWQPLKVSLGNWKGQGGDLQEGGPQPGSRFTVTGDCVTDNLTGLMWTRNANLLVASVTWAEALIYARDLTLCGYHDWRLPTDKELQSLINGKVANSATWLNTQGFINVQPFRYWSSIWSDHARLVWIVDMEHGESGPHDIILTKTWFYVWPVRSVLKTDSSGLSQAATTPGAEYQVIQRIPVPDEVDRVGLLKVKSDGSLVLYTALLRNSLENALLANTTRLTNTLLDTAKQVRAKGGDPRISVEAADYSFSTIEQVEVSPFDSPVDKAGVFAGVEGGWEWVAYYVTTQKAGPFVLINELKAPAFRPVSFAAGAFPSFLQISRTQKEVAYWAQAGSKIILMVGREQAAQLEEGSAARGPALFFRGAPPIGMAYVAESPAKGSALFLNNQKVSLDYEAIEPALNSKGRNVGYIAKAGNRSVLFVNGKEQATGFVPAHGLTFFAGGDACAFAAVQGGREFVVKNGLKSLSTFVRVTQNRDFGHVLDLAFNSMATKVAYVAEDGKKEWIMVDDRKMTPEFDRVAFNRENYEWGGPLVFAGYDVAKRVIIVGKL
jgi:hypothetical protein